MNISDCYLSCSSSSCGVRIEANAAHVDGSSKANLIILIGQMSCWKAKTPVFIFPMNKKVCKGNSLVAVTLPDAGIPKFLIVPEDAV